MEVYILYFLNIRLENLSALTNSKFNNKKVDSENRTTKTSVSTVRTTTQGFQFFTNGSIKTHLLHFNIPYLYVIFIINEDFVISKHDNTTALFSVYHCQHIWIGVMYIDI